MRKLNLHEMKQVSGGLVGGPVAEVKRKVSRAVRKLWPWD